VPPLILLGALALQGCAIQDRYGNSYGGFFDYGNQYAWQRTACETEIDAKNIAAELRRRYMQCCMWRNGVPIDDSTGCAAPPYYSG
jgi:hypothetical protein